MLAPLHPELVLALGITLRDPQHHLEVVGDGLCEPADQVAFAGPEEDAENQLAADDDLLDVPAQVRRCPSAQRTAAW